MCDLVVDGSWFFSEHNVDVNYVPILDRLVEIMRMPCPSLSQDVEVMDSIEKRHSGSAYV